MGIMTLASSRRVGVGKGPARRLRAAGHVPAVYYGRGEAPVPLSIRAKDLDELFDKSEGSNVIVDLSFEGEAAADRKALIREIQRDPVGGHVLHVDLQHISLTERITVEVPIELVGIPVGVKDGGGILEHLLRELEIECLPTEIPANVAIDVTALGIGDSLHVSDLSVPNATIWTERGRTIATVVPPTVLEAPKVEEVVEVAAEPELVKEKEKEGEVAAGGQEG